MNGRAVHGIYAALLDAYGPQGWWPLLDVRGCQPTASGVLQGYHPGDFSFPRTAAQRFEICVGAVLTQNTAWPNVEKALGSLQRLEALAPECLLALPDARLEDALRPSGYFRVKRRKCRFAPITPFLEGTRDFGLRLRCRSSRAKKGLI